VLLRYATHLREVSDAMASTLTRDAIEAIIGWIPESWLTARSGKRSAEQQRADYVAYFMTRLANRSAFVEEAVRAR
jgi:hypothetical protein